MPAFSPSDILTRESVNAVSLFHPTSLPPTPPPPSLPSISHTTHTCAVSPLIILLPSPLACLSHDSPRSFPCPCLYVPSLSHLTPPLPSHPLTRATCCLCSYGRSESERMTEADFHLCDHTNFAIMFGQSPSLTCLMELPCLAGICSHATGRDPFFF